MNLTGHKTIILLALLIIGFSHLNGQSARLKFAPKLNVPYPFEAEYLISYNEGAGVPVGQVQSLIKIDYNITFLNRGQDFSLEIERIKGGILPLLDGDSARRKYFDTDNMIGKDASGAKLWEPFIGKRILVSKEGITIDGQKDEIVETIKEDRILQALIQGLHVSNPSPIYAKRLNNGTTWEEVDSISVTPYKYVKVNNQYTVKDVTGNNVLLTSMGQYAHRGELLMVAQRLAINKKTGLPETWFQCVRVGEMEMHIQIKDKQAAGPDITEEYFQLQMMRVLNYIQSNQDDQPIAQLPVYPDNQLTEQVREQWIGHFLENLSITMVEKDMGFAFVYPYEFLQVDTNINFINTSYVKSGVAKVITETSDTLLLPPLFQKPGQEYFTLQGIGPYFFNPFNPKPGSFTCTVDLKLYMAGASKKDTLTREKTKNGRYEATFTDTTFMLTYNLDGVTPGNSYPMKSITCFNKKGEEVPYKVEQIVYQKLDQTKNILEPYTATEIVKLFIERDEITTGKTSAFVFGATDVHKVVIETLTNYQEYARTLTKTISDY